ncbi:MAG: DUF655 domain-containing protein [Haloarculaceae archaeon]
MTDSGSDGQRVAVVLDYLPHGRPGDDRPQYQKEPLAYALDVSEFGLYAVTLADDEKLTIGGRFDLTADGVRRARRVDVDDLSGGARSELEYAVEEIVDEDERRFVDFYNDAQPITLRLHQLDLLPGIGKKLRNGILDERKQRPFESFEDVDERVSGLHDPRGILVDRILEELREDDLKYRTFVGQRQQSEE